MDIAVLAGSLSTVSLPPVIPHAVQSSPQQGPKFFQPGLHDLGQYRHAGFGLEVVLVSAIRMAPGMLNP